MSDKDTRCRSRYRLDDGYVIRCFQVLGHGGYHFANAEGVNVTWDDPNAVPSSPPTEPHEP